MDQTDPYRSDRDEEPAEGPAQTEEDRRSSLPPGATTAEGGPGGDVDRALPYSGADAPLRIEPEPFPEDPTEEGDRPARDRRD